MIVREIKTIVAEFSEEEREILSKAERILLDTHLKAEQLNDLPMCREDFNLLNNIWDYSNIIQDYLYCRD